MDYAQEAVAARVDGRRSAVTMPRLVLGLALMTLVALVQVSPALAELATEAPVSVTVTGGEFGGSVGLMPGDEITLTPIVIGAKGDDMLYALHADVIGPDELIRKVRVTVRAADGALLYDGPLARLSIGVDEVGFPERRLAAGATERLSVTIAVSLEAGNEIQGATFAVTWRADAIGAGMVTKAPAAQG